MCRLNFPTIHKSIIKNRNENHAIQNFICIRQGVALIFGLNFIFAFDLKTYFLSNQLVEEIDKDSFDELMQWFEGKNLIPEFWEKIAGKNNNFQVINSDVIHVETEKTSFDLYYEEPEIDTERLTLFLDFFKKTFELPNQVVYSHVPNMGIISTFLKGFGGLIKDSQMIIKFKNKLTYQVFTINNMSYIFGLISSDENAKENSFAFDNYKDFINKYYNGETT